MSEQEEDENENEEREEPLSNAGCFTLFLLSAAIAYPAAWFGVEVHKGLMDRDKAAIEKGLVQDWNGRWVK